MNLKQANRCVALASFLEKLNENKWEYSYIRQANYEAGEKKLTQDGVCIKAKCNTTACALGWCPEVFPEKFKADTGNVDMDTLVYGGVEDIDIKYKSSYGWVSTSSDMLSNWFGFSKDVAEDLFWGYRLEEYYNKDTMEDVTAKDVAKKLYDLVREAGYKVVYE